MDAITSALGGISDFVLAAAEQPWVYLLVLVCCVVDGFFPPFPSESVVVGLASLVLTQGVLNPWLLILVAALGAFLGDNIAYGIGRGIGTTRFRWMRRPRMQRSFGWAGDELAKRAASLILVARFIPIGRVAVNLTAGATGYSQRRFVALTALSGTVWAGYSVGIGAVAGTWFQHNHLLGVAVAVGIAVVIGILVDRGTAFVRGATPLEAPALQLRDELEPARGTNPS
ncbi:DedA family protein [Arthrobacter burdickii]|jgi:membrane-associated protein|uniref:DedA family protein n=1 Tax=Arthrobacter burdickii TaxID=3035920 RepID=A0ABT8K5Q6_9MICC|nr:DedA family protein [Arthrobacter burdickii]MDN4612492.1 DedA family protein [Arthrobacter burdickii]